MVTATFVAFLVVSIVAFLALWAVIEGETSNPPVMDREEAERRAIEQGGRGGNGRSTGERSTDERDDGDVGWDG